MGGGRLQEVSPQGVFTLNHMNLSLNHNHLLIEISMYKAPISAKYCIILKC